MRLLASGTPPVARCDQPRYCVCAPFEIASELPQPVTTRPSATAPSADGAIGGSCAHGSWCVLADNSFAKPAAVTSTRSSVANPTVAPGETFWTGSGLDTIAS